MAIVCPQSEPYGLTPQILLQGNPPITDTVNWVKVSGLYQATGGEQYITIGNFNYDSTTVTQIVDAASPYDAAYYYIDDVSIYEIKKSNAGRDTIICEGDSVQLGTTNYEGVTYSWQPTTGLSNLNIGNPMASPASTTTYYLTQTTPCAVTTDTVVVTVCDMGIAELGNDKYFKLYPNPTTGVFTISTEGSKIKEIKVLNLLGEEIYSTTINNQQSTINLSEQAQGIYFVQVKTEKGIMRKKLVFQ